MLFLQSKGISYGDRVAILLGNRAEFVEAAFAIAKLGAIVVPVSTREQSPGINHILNDSGASLLIYEDELSERLPRADEVLRDGDIINVDITSELHGWHGDTSATFCIGEVSAEARHLVETTQRALELGIAEVRPGARLGDIGAAISELATREGCGVVTDFGGHGIGRQMHLPPHVSHVGQRGHGLALREGMTFTIEPMLTLGAPEIRVLDDEWTVVTKDGKWSAQFEHTVLVTRRGAEILTRP